MEQNFCHGHFTDPRDGRIYGTIKIGNQTWLAQNLAYDCKGSKCYGNDPANAAKYGRLYDWETAKKAVPRGWHLPSNEEWQTLIDFAGGNEVAGKKLKAEKGWKHDYLFLPCEEREERIEQEKVNGTDEFGFFALPSGNGFKPILRYTKSKILRYFFRYRITPIAAILALPFQTVRFHGIGLNASWWSADNGSYVYLTNCNYMELFDKKGVTFYSVRCIRNDDSYKLHKEFPSLKSIQAKFNEEQKLKEDALNKRHDLAIKEYKKVLENITIKNPTNEVLTDEKKEHLFNIELNLAKRKLVDNVVASNNTQNNLSRMIGEAKKRGENIEPLARQMKVFGELVEQNYLTIRYIDIHPLYKPLSPKELYGY